MLPLSRSEFAPIILFEARVFFGYLRGVPRMLATSRQNLLHSLSPYSKINRVLKERSKISELESPIFQSCIL
jgi:hypothetical protein